MVAYPTGVDELQLLLLQCNIGEVVASRGSLLPPLAKSPWCLYLRIVIRRLRMRPCRDLEQEMSGPPVARSLKFLIVSHPGSYRELEEQLSANGMRIARMDPEMQRLNLEGELERKRVQGKLAQCTMC